MNEGESVGQLVLISLDDWSKPQQQQPIGPLCVTVSVTDDHATLLTHARNPAMVSSPNRPAAWAGAYISARARRHLGVRLSSARLLKEGPNRQPDL